MLHEKLYLKHFINKRKKVRERNLASVFCVFLSSFSICAINNCEYYV